MTRPPILPLPKNHRLNADLYARVGVYTFITLRAFEQFQPFSHAPIADLMVKTLLAEQSRLGCHVSAYCLMPNHLHYLITPEREGCSVLTFTDQFKGKSTHLSWSLGWQGKLWQSRSYDHILRADEDWRKVAEYVLLNPVRKGWVGEWTEWRWSGLAEEADTNPDSPLEEP
jgi:REP element-mobilizing transposase RayT